MSGVLAVGVELRSAALCVDLDCNTVFDRTANRRCPRCGSDECYPLSMWLDRRARTRPAADAAGASRYL